MKGTIERSGFPCMTSNVMPMYIFIFSFIFKLKKADGFYNASQLCSCGAVNRFLPLIVGGRKVAFNRYPWLVLILLHDKYRCGGSIINSHYVLTAGHCVASSSVNIEPHHFTIVLGAHNRLNRNEHTRVYRRVESIKLHESFHGDDVCDFNDIALIRMDKKISYSRYLRAVCLPEFLDENVYKVEKGKAIGWGAESYEGMISRIPLEAELDILSDEECGKITTSIDFKSHFYRENGTMFCAYTERRDACKGDSGGPFVIQSSSNKMVQVGIISWGIKCAEKGMPGVYTKLTSYISWIRHNTRNSELGCFQ